MGDIETYRSYWKLLDLLYSYDVAAGPVDRGSLYHRPNPFFNQTTEGFFLEMENGNHRLASSWGVNRLWTPWGLAQLYIDAASFKRNLKEIRSRLGAIIHQKKIVSKIHGPIGPIYRLSRIDQIELPFAQVKPVCQYASATDITIEWALLSSSLEQEQRAKEFFQKRAVSK